MINYLAKTLLWLHVGLSLLAMTWAASLFLQMHDWGWIEPRQELEGRLASEYDKSLAAVKQAVRTRDLALAPVKPAEDAIAQIEGFYPANHLYYVQELRRLRDAADPIEVKALKGPGQLDAKGPTGKPVLEAKIDGLDKSLVKYQAETEKLRGDIKGVEDEITKTLAATNVVTFELTGKDDAGMKKTYGLYDLVDGEYQALVAARRERDDLKLPWAQSLREAEQYTLRRSVLEETIRRLEERAGKMTR